VKPTLFGDWAVLREWGRRGSPGTVRSRATSTAATRKNARSAHDQAPLAALQHGYAQVIAD
jgi:hypothetical protein